MAREILSEALWRRVEPCLPAVPPRRRVPGPHPLGDRSVLTGILFVLKSGLAWEELPAELGAGSGMTCLRRLRRWQTEGVWRRIRRALAGAFDPHEIDWKRAEVQRVRVHRAARTSAPRRGVLRSRGEGASRGRQSPSRYEPQMHVLRRPS